MTTQQDSSPEFEAEQDKRREEHLAGLEVKAEDVPDVTDPEQWRDAPKVGGGA